MILMPTPPIYHRHNRPQPTALRLSAWLLICVLTLTGCALSEEPPIVRTAVLPTVTPTLPPDAGRPLQRIDLAKGAEIFTGERGCQLCHGVAGEANGPVRANIACAMVSFRDPASNQSKALTAWFALVSNGNNGGAACPMPPWKHQLDEQARWNVTNYVYSLHYTAPQIVMGKQVWAQHCTSCHTESGAGTATLPNLADPATLVRRSDTQLFRLLTDGLADGTHKFAALSEDERRAVVAYSRSLGWDNTQLIGVNFALATPTPAPSATPAAPDTPSIVVSGTVRNGTAGGAAPGGLKLTLRLREATASGFIDALTLETTSRADGAFTYADVPRRNGLVYVVSAEYQGVLQTSGLMQLETGSGPTLDLSFPVYETTTDASQLRIEQQQVFIDFLGPTVALVQQGVLFQNTGDRVYIGDPQTGVTLDVALPDAATQIELSRESGAYRITGTRIQGTLPIPPGETGLQFAYQLAFQEALTITQPTRYAIAEMVVHLPTGGGSFIADAGFSRGQTLQLSTTSYDAYPLRRLTPAGDQVSFTVRFGTPENARRGLFTGVLVAAVALMAGMALAIWRLGQR
jgi:mono/diheme cytochrome c family protein